MQGFPVPMASGQGGVVPSREVRRRPDERPCSGLKARSFDCCPEPLPLARLTVLALWGLRDGQDMPSARSDNASYSEGRGVVPLQGRGTEQDFTMSRFKFCSTGRIGELGSSGTRGKCLHFSRSLVTIFNCGGHGEKKN